jgi:hypothetical protein
MGVAVVTQSVIETKQHRGDQDQTSQITREDVLQAIRSKALTEAHDETPELAL